MDKRIMNRVQEHYNKVVELGYECVGVFLQGSQNYKLDTEQSDIDTKAIVLPTFEDIVLNKKPMSCTHVMDNGEHIDIKDIRLMFNEFRKQNINFVEILFTEYKVIDEYYEDRLLPLFYYKEEIARYNPLAALKCAVGQAKCRFKEIQNEFDYKKCSNILRFEDFCMSYIDGKKYLECIVPTELEFIKSVKSGTCHMTSNELLKKGEYALEHCKLMLDAYELFGDKTVNHKVDVLLKNVVSNILVDWFQYEFDVYY